MRVQPRLFNADHIRQSRWLYEHYRFGDEIQTFRHVERLYDSWDRPLDWWSELRVRWRLAWAVFLGKYDAVHFPK